MGSHALYNLRKKRHLEINELTEILNKKYGTHYEQFDDVDIRL